MHLSIVAAVNELSPDYLWKIVIGLAVLAIFFGVLVFFIISLVKSISKKQAGWIIGACLSGIALLVIISILIAGVYKSISTLTTFAPETQAPINGRAVFTSDQLLKIQIPSHWQILKDMNTEASLQVGNLSREEYLIVLTDLKSDFEGSLQDHAQITTRIILKNVTAGKINEPKEFQINGMPAIQYEISGTVDRTRIIYLHTTVEANDAYHQILSWSLPSKKKTAFPVFHRVLKTVTESGGDKE
jgi:hypothetical protein